MGFYGLRTLWHRDTVVHNVHLTVRVIIAHLSFLTKGWHISRRAVEVLRILVMSPALEGLLRLIPKGSNPNNDTLDFGRVVSTVRYTCTLGPKHECLKDPSGACFRYSKVMSVEPSCRVSYKTTFRLDHERISGTAHQKHNVRGESLYFPRPLPFEVQVHTSQTLWS
ncbi:hypothetical protein AcV7_005544 [Taiwanofungus camphoratus]|nr:hypothetical protein AcV7_005544 [Antrodia cinnamomea]